MILPGARGISLWHPANEGWIIQGITVDSSAGTWTADMSMRISSKWRPVVGFVCPTHREVAREAVRQSLVVLKNENGILPLAKTDATYVVAGSHANNAGMQCGGWTIKWQGKSGPVAGATSIYEGIRQSAGGNRVILAHDSIIRNVDAAIIVVGEAPYAEWRGDQRSGKLVLDKASRKLIAGYHNAGIRVITVLVSGRPLLVSREIDMSDAFIAAWLPGSEGSGVADVLFGDYSPTGKLGHTWPANRGHIPLRKAKAAMPLFEYGYGL